MSKMRKILKNLLFFYLFGITCEDKLRENVSLLFRFKILWKINLFYKDAGIV